MIRRYDKRADAENSVGEAQREGLLAIPSKKFESNESFFQLVMLAYNLWRWMKLLWGHSQAPSDKASKQQTVAGLAQQTIRVTRLRLLYLAAKISFHGNRDHVYSSVHDERTGELIDFLDYLDERREQEGLAA